MIVHTAQFGDIEVGEDRVLSFPQGLPGLESLTSYVLVEPEETRPLLWLQSTTDADVTLPVVDTFYVLPEYALDVRDEEVEYLGVADPMDLLVLTVIVVPEDVTKMTGNLAAPIFVNIKTNKGKQVIAEGEHPVRYPIFTDICLAEKRREQHAGTHTQDR